MEWMGGPAWRKSVRLCGIGVAAICVGVGMSNWAGLLHCWHCWDGVADVMAQAGGWGHGARATLGLDATIGRRVQ